MGTEPTQVQAGSQQQGQEAPEEVDEAGEEALTELPQRLAGKHPAPSGPLLKPQIASRPRGLAAVAAGTDAGASGGGLGALLAARPLGRGTAPKMGLAQRASGGGLWGGDGDEGIGAEVEVVADGAAGPDDVGLSRQPLSSQQMSQQARPKPVVPLLKRRPLGAVRIAGPLGGIRPGQGQDQQEEIEEDEEGGDAGAAGTGAGLLGSQQPGSQAGVGREVRQGTVPVLGRMRRPLTSSQQPGLLQQQGFSTGEGETDGRYDDPLETMGGEGDEGTNAQADEEGEEGDDVDGPSQRLAMGGRLRASGRPLLGSLAAVGLGAMGAPGRHNGTSNSKTAGSSNHTVVMPNLEPARLALLDPGRILGELAADKKPK